MGLYDGVGNVTSHTDSRGKVTTFQYDALSRLLFTGFGTQGQSYESTVQNTFDAGDRLTGAVDSAAGTITRSFDSLDRLLSESTPQGSVSYEYDAAGRRTSMTVAGEPQVTYGYDSADRLTQITKGSSSVTMAYDDASRTTSLTLPNGIVQDYTYGPASEITGITYRRSGSPIGDLTYSYDGAGRRSAVAGSYAWTGLPSAVSSATHDGANRLTSWAGTTLSYDAEGNLTSDGTNGYTWDARGQLASIAGGVTASYAYDAFGRRVRKTVGASTTQFLYDGLNPIQELSAGGSPTANLLTGLGTDQYFSRTEDGASRSFLTDALGSTIALADNGGTVQTEYTYQPFGGVTASGEVSSNSLQFTGRENDVATNLFYNRARYYSPIFQRFISQDPVGFVGGDANLYAYVGNAPTIFTDRLGLEKESCSSWTAWTCRIADLASWISVIPIPWLAATASVVALIGYGIGGNWEGVSTAFVGLVLVGTGATIINQFRAANASIVSPFNPYSRTAVGSFVWFVNLLRSGVSGSMAPRSWSG